MKPITFILCRGCHQAFAVTGEDPTDREACVCWQKVENLDPQVLQGRHVEGVCAPCAATEAKNKILGDEDIVTRKLRLSGITPVSRREAL